MVTIQGAFKSFRHSWNDNRQKGAPGVASGRVEFLYNDEMLGVALAKLAREGTVYFTIQSLNEPEVVLPKLPDGADAEGGGDETS